MDKRFLKGILFFLAIFLALFVAYGPAITTQYLYHDDVVYFMTTPTRIEPPGSLFNVAIGRFLGGHMLIGLGLLVHTMSDLNIVRFLSVLQLSLCGFLFFLWTNRYFLTTAQSLLLAIATFTLPPFQIMAAQAGMGFQPMGILLAILAAMVIDRVPAGDAWAQRLFHRNVFFSVTLLLSAISTYQPAAMFFWAMLGFILLFSEQSSKELEKRAIHFVWAGSITFCLYGIILQITKKFFIKFSLLEYNPYALATDYIGKIKWFFAEPMVSVLNLWNIFPSILYARLLIVFILMGAFLKMIQLRQAKRLDPRKILFIAFVLFGLLFACFLPNLASVNNLFFYRSVPALMALILFIVLASCREYLGLFKKINKVLLLSFVFLGFAVSGIVLARQTIVQHRIIPSQREWNLFFSAITQNSLNQYKSIYIIEPQEEHLRHRADEYRNLTTRYSHNIVGLLSCALRELSKGKMRIYHIAYSPEKKKALFIFEELLHPGVYLPYEIGIASGPALEQVEEGTLVIDMRPLHDF